MTDTSSVLSKIVTKLCANEADGFKCEPHCPAMHPLPSAEIVSDILGQLKAILFPHHFGHADSSVSRMAIDMTGRLERLLPVIKEQILRGLCYDCRHGEKSKCRDCEGQARDLSLKFLDQLPDIKALLDTDIAAAYEGDPAAKSPDEAVFCYPGIKAMINFRLAHLLHTLGVSLIPRIMTEQAHSETGIDIHPGAQIAERFFIDHGTGVVIGETSIIGKNVRLYQGVTLGAKSFPLDSNGKPIKGIARHPVVEDDVIIYSEATILGRITIGKGSVIGGNVWLTHSIPPGSRITQAAVQEGKFEAGAGI